MYLFCAYFYNIFQKISKYFFDKKTNLKSSILVAVWIFYFSAAPTAQNSPELIICFIDSCIQWSVVPISGIALSQCNCNNIVKDGNISETFTFDGAPKG